MAVPRTPSTCSPPAGVHNRTMKASMRPQATPGASGCLKAACRLPGRPASCGGSAGVDPRGSVWFALMGEAVTSIVGARDTAREQMPPSLRDEVRLVGELLAQVIAEQAGDSLLADVEHLRRTVIRARTEGDLRGGDVEAADALVSSWSLDRAEQVARAFTCYFHLVNLAEERYRARALREADYGASGPAEALAAALAGWFKVSWYHPPDLKRACVDHAHEL